MHIDTLVLYLLHNKILGLYTVHPLRQGSYGIMGGFACGGIDGQHPVGLRQVKEPAVLVGGNDPVGYAVIVQLKGVIRKTFEEAAPKETHMAV